MTCSIPASGYVIEFNTIQSMLRSCAVKSCGSNTDDKQVKNFIYACLDEHIAVAAIKSRQEH